MLPDLCPSNKTLNKYMPPLLKFCPAPTHPQQYSFQHACIQIRLQQLDSAGYRILWNPVSSVDTAGYRIQLDTLRSAAFCVRLRSAWIQVCVQLRSGTCVQLRSAFGCVLRSAAFCVLRSAAFCVRLRSAFSCVQESAFSCVLRSAAFSLDTARRNPKLLGGHSL